MAQVPSRLQKYVEAAAPVGMELKFKPMFGGIGVYANGRMCISLSDVGISLKLSDTDRADLLKLRGAKPLQYEPHSPPSKSYVVVPQSIHGKRELLGAWIAKSAAFSAAAPAKKTRKRRSSKRPVPR